VNGVNQACVSVVRNKEIFKGEKDDFFKKKIVE